MKAPEEKETDAPGQGINIRKRGRRGRLQPWPLKWLIGLLFVILALMWLLNRL